jgi:hypothetical protein
MAHTLELRIPEQLLDLVKNRNSGSGNNSGNASTDEDEDEDEDWWPRKNLKVLLRTEGVRLPRIDSEKLKRPVLKCRVQGPNFPDPWLLITKAAENYSFMVYRGSKFRPACRPPDESLLGYEEVLRHHEHRERQRDIPVSVNMPTTPVGNPWGADEAHVTTPRDNKREVHVVAPPDNKREIEESYSWENLSD